MALLRLLALGVLFYVLYKLLAGIWRNKAGDAGGRPASGGALPPHDVLMEDPICHTYVPKKQAVTLNQGDVTYYFCSQKCREAFSAKQKKENEP